MRTKYAHNHTKGDYIARLSTLGPKFESRCRQGNKVGIFGFFSRFSRFNNSLHFSIPPPLFTLFHIFINSFHVILFYFSTLFFRNLFCVFPYLRCIFLETILCTTIKSGSMIASLCTILWNNAGLITVMESKYIKNFHPNFN